MYYDRNAKPLPQIKEDNTVRIRKGKSWEPAIVSEKHTAPRSFIVTTPDGTAYRRNRCHLLPTNEAGGTSPAYDDPVAPVAATPAVDISPPVTASNAELPALGSTDGRSDLQTPTQCTSSGRTVRLPARFRKDYIMNWTIYRQNQTVETCVLLILLAISFTPYSYTEGMFVWLWTCSSWDFLYIRL